MLPGLQQHSRTDSHCPKNGFYLRLKINSICHGTDATVCVWFFCQIFRTVCAPKPDIYRCIHSSRGTVFMYEEIQIIIIAHLIISNVLYSI